MWASTYNDENGFDGGDYSVLTKPRVGLCKSRGASNYDDDG